MLTIRRVREWSGGRFSLKSNMIEQTMQSRILQRNRRCKLRLACMFRSQLLLAHPVPISTSINSACSNNRNSSTTVSRHHAGFLSWELRALHHLYRQSHTNTAFYRAQPSAPGTVFSKTRIVHYLLHSFHSSLRHRTHVYYNPDGILCLQLLLWQCATVSMSRIAKVNMPALVAALWHIACENAKGWLGFALLSRHFAQLSTYEYPIHPDFAEYRLPLHPLILCTLLCIRHFQENWLSKTTKMRHCGGPLLKRLLRLRRSRAKLPELRSTVQKRGCFLKSLNAKDVCEFQDVALRLMSGCDSLSVNLILLKVTRTLRGYRLQEGGIRSLEAQIEAWRLSRTNQLPSYWRHCSRKLRSS